MGGAVETDWCRLSKCWADSLAVYPPLATRLTRTKPEVTEMDDVTLKELLFSLSWSAWSCYHNRNATEILQKHFPNVDAKALVHSFCAVIDSPPGEGSPK
mgnify:CR=1 FL=1